MVTTFHQVVIEVLCFEGSYYAVIGTSGRLTDYQEYPITTTKEQLKQYVRDMSARLLA